MHSGWICIFDANTYIQQVTSCCFVSGLSTFGYSLVCLRLSLLFCSFLFFLFFPFSYSYLFSLIVIPVDVSQQYKSIVLMEHVSHIMHLPFDRECSPCRPKTFSSLMNAEKCKIWDNCKPGTFLKVWCSVSGHSILV